MQPLLSELHAHTTWSDGELSMHELVDLYGAQGFDVLCVTDHVHPPGDACGHLGIPPARQAEYLAEAGARPRAPALSTTSCSSPAWS